MNQEDEIIIRRYLLGELAEQERKKFEERLMTDDELFNQVLIAEEELEELAEKYVDGSLAVGERKTVERIFLSTHEGRQQLNFNLALNRYISEENEQKNAWQPVPAIVPAPRQITFADIFRHRMPMVAMALAAMVLLAALSTWLVIRSSWLESQVDQSRADQRATEKRLEDLQQKLDNSVKQVDQLRKDNQEKQEENQALQADKAKLAEQLASIDRSGGDIETGVLVSALLLPGDPRSSSNIDVITPDSSTKTIRLRLRVPGTGYKRFRAELAREDGSSPSVPQGALRFNRKGSETIVTMTLSSKSLPPGDYILKLTPATANTDEQIEAHAYRFRIATK